MPEGPISGLDNASSDKKRPTGDSIQYKTEYKRRRKLENIISFHYSPRYSSSCISDQKVEKGGEKEINP